MFELNTNRVLSAIHYLLYNKLSLGIVQEGSDLE